MQHKRAGDAANFKERLGLSKQLARSVVVEGKEVPIIHQYGKGGDYPTVRAGLAKIAGKVASKFGAPVVGDRYFLGSETIIVEKFKEVYAPGFGQDAVNKLAQQGYDFRRICAKIGRPLLNEIDITHTIKHYKPGWLNLMLNEGINQIWNLLRENDATNYYTNALARVGVGNSSTAASATDTGLLGGSTAFVGMEGGFPTHATQRIDFNGSFGNGVAEFAWEEFTVDNGVTPNHNLQRLVTSKGTKSAGETWTAEIQITGS